MIRPSKPRSHRNHSGEKDGIRPGHANEIMNKGRAEDEIPGWPRDCLVGRRWRWRKFSNEIYPELGLNDHTTLHKNSSYNWPRRTETNPTPSPGSSSFNQAIRHQGWYTPISLLPFSFVDYRVLICTSSLRTCIGLPTKMIQNRKPSETPRGESQKKTGPSF